MRCRVLLLFLLGCVGCVGGDNQPAAVDRCTKLRDHLVQLQVADIHVATGIDREAHRRVLSHALGDDFATSCASKLTEAQVDCALEAADAVAAAACAR